MKAKIFYVFLLCSFMLMSCATREERQVKRLQRFTIELKTNSDRYTDEQWQQAIN